MDRLRILSLNVRGLGSAAKSAKLVNELVYLNCDIFLLQETHSKLKNLKSSGKVIVFGPSGPESRLVLPSFLRLISLENCSIFV